MRKLKLYLTVAILVVSLISSALAAYQDWQHSQTVLGTSDLSTSEVNKEVSNAIVARVIDGDTVELQDGRKVRYIGIDTPETKHPTKGLECFGKEASAKNKELVEGKEVRLEKDVSETDRYGRLLRYVWLGSEMVNQKLVAEGFANASSYPPDIKYQHLFQQAQQLAQESKIGLWGGCAVEE